MICELSSVFAVALATMLAAVAGVIATGMIFHFATRPAARADSSTAHPDGETT
jgi:hypothetical protein